MGRGTKKVGIVGKYGPRYGSSIRKQLKKIEVDQHKKYDCFFCGKNNVKRNFILNIIFKPVQTWFSEFQLVGIMTGVQ